MTLAQARKALRSHSDPHKGRVHRGFFKKTDDIFLGISAHLIRQIARDFQNLSLDSLRELMKSNVHDERSLAHAILVRQFRAGDEKAQSKIFDFYIQNRKWIRSWDGVDDSAPYIAGPYLMKRNKAPLYKLALAPRLWDRRIAIVATWWFIRQGDIRHTLRIARMLLRDEEDLIHKATGWMLREVGKRDLRALERFLKANYRKMPRTTLRYAIERFPQKKRLAYLSGKIAS
jgi:3-methyladenine DNA glycosylase AlkD